MVLEVQSWGYSVMICEFRCDLGKGSTASVHRGKSPYDQLVLAVPHELVQDLLQTTELCSDSSESTSGISPSEVSISWRQTLFIKAIRDAVSRDAHLMETHQQGDKEYCLLSMLGVLTADFLYEEFLPSHYILGVLPTALQCIKFPQALAYLLDNFSQQCVIL